MLLECRKRPALPDTHGATEDGCEGENSRTRLSANPQHSVRGGYGDEEYETSPASGLHDFLHGSVRRRLLSLLQNALFFARCCT